MKSICKFELKQDYEDYENEVDMLGHVIEENKVYLKLGRHFEYCIHADFHIGSNKNVQLLGNDANLLKFAKIRITNTSTNESRVINPTKLVAFEAGDYKIDYGVWIDDNKETYTTPNWTFEYCNEVTYIQVDPIVTKLSRIFAAYCTNLTGIMFGEPDQYPEGPCVFSDPYSHNDVIINDHISFTENHSSAFLRGNTKIGNIYVSDGVTGFSSCFGSNNPCMGEQYESGGHWTTNSDTYKSEIYLGAQVTSVKFQSTNKISRCIISSENPYLIYDSAINSVIKKDLNDQGKKVIVTGLGCGYQNGYLKIPSGYVFGNSYETYSSLKEIKVLDLSEFDSTQRNPDGVTGGYFDGFRDLSELETLILPRNIHCVSSKYASGFPKVKNLIVPVKFAPIVVWSGTYGYWGDRAHVMVRNYTSLFNGSNCSGPIGRSVPVAERNLYVLDSTNQNDKDSWTNMYDGSTVTTDWADNKDNPTYYFRPNIWKYVQMSPFDSNIPENYSDCWLDRDGNINPSNSPCQEFTLNYLSEQQMTNLISSLNPNNNN